MTVKVVGAAATVVDTGLLKIDELAGNVASSDDRISIAKVVVSAPTEEPWLTLSYDEWICVTKGRIVMALPDGSEVNVAAGQTCLVDKGTRFQPRFPVGDTEYIPVCLPAFHPHRCVREEGVSAVKAKLEQLHLPKGPPAETLYHMCEKTRWEAAVASGKAYFPPTFEQDGFTHATAVPERLIGTANHFYQDSTDDWVCLSFKRSALRDAHGITVRDEQAMPVGDKPVGDTWTAWICPHVVGGLPPSVVDYVIPMVRDSAGKFLRIEGLAEDPDAMAD